jgi:hypothetical protein
MTVNHTIKSPLTAAVPSLFCPPHLIAGEDPVAYDEFLWLTLNMRTRA